MIKAQHNKLYIWFFRKYFGLLRRVHFRKTTVVSEISVPESQAVLLFQNHFSWWDGYWSDLLSKTIFHRKFHVMMLEENLRKRIFLNRCGVFSIQKNNRDFLNSLAYTSEILSDRRNLVTIYPAGEIWTQHRQTVQFQSGIDRIISHSPEKFTLVFAVFLTDYFGFPRPEVRIYLETYSGERNVVALEKAYHEFYQTCITKQTE